MDAIEIGRRMRLLATGESSRPLTEIRLAILVTENLSRTAIDALV